MKLFAYIIDEKIIGVDLPCYNMSQLNGNSPFTIDETAPEGYADITSISNLKNYWPLCTQNFLLVRKMVTVLFQAKGWANLSDDEKDVVIDYGIYTDTANIIPFYMSSKNMTQEEAIDAYLDKRAFIIRKASECCTRNIEHYKFTKIIIKYLEMHDAENFVADARDHISDYKSIALIGTQYGDNRDGIMDFIEGTGSYAYTGGGLAQYNINAPYTLQQMIEEMKDVLLRGNLN